MTVQIVEIAGEKMAMLPVADYERLLDRVDDRADRLAAQRAEERRNGGEEYLPSEMVDRLLAGEAPLRVWRHHRGLTLDTLSARVGISIAHLSDIERGRRKGAPALWRRLATSLEVSADEILPET